jgi:hypothetical protein
MKISSVFNFMKISSVFPVLLDTQRRTDREKLQALTRFAKAANECWLLTKYSCPTVGWRIAIPHMTGSQSSYTGNPRCYKLTLTHVISQLNNPFRSNASPTTCSATFNSVIQQQSLLANSHWIFTHGSPLARKSKNTRISPIQRGCFCYKGGYCQRFTQLISVRVFIYQ